MKLCSWFMKLFEQKTRAALLKFDKINKTIHTLNASRSLFCSLEARPSAKTLARNTLATSTGPWLTVVPRQPCSTICSIFGSGGSLDVAVLSSSVFFLISSMATLNTSSCSQS